MSRIHRRNKSQPTLLECAICFEGYSVKDPQRLPRLLHCAHTFCTKDLNDMLHRGITGVSQSPPQPASRTSVSSSRSSIGSLSSPRGTPPPGSLLSSSPAAPSSSSSSASAVNSVVRQIKQAFEWNNSFEYNLLPRSRNSSVRSNGGGAAGGGNGLISSSSTDSKEDEPVYLAKIECPTCRRLTGVSVVEDLKINYALVEILERLAAPEHKYLGMASVHEVSEPGEDVGDPVARTNSLREKKDATTCKNHMKPYEVFCVSCQMPLCSVCKAAGDKDALKHDGHSLMPIGALADESRAMTNKAMKDAQRVSAICEQYAASIYAAFDRLKKNSEQQTRRITAHFEDLMSRLKERHAYLLSQVKQEHKSKHMTLSLSLEDVANLTSEASTFVYECETTLAPKDDGGMTSVRNYQPLQGKFDHLKELCAQMGITVGDATGGGGPSAVPMIDVDIDCHLDDIAMINTIANYGAVGVPSAPVFQDPVGHGTNVTLTWQVLSRAILDEEVVTQFELWYQDPQTATDKWRPVYQGAKPEYKLSGLGSGTHLFRVRVKNSVGWSKWSEVLRYEVNTVSVRVQAYHDKTVTFAFAVPHDAKVMQLVDAIAQSSKFRRNTQNDRRHICRVEDVACIIDGKGGKVDMSCPIGKLDLSTVYRFSYHYHPRFPVGLMSGESDVMFQGAANTKIWSCCRREYEDAGCRVYTGEVAANPRSRSLLGPKNRH